MGNTDSSSSSSNSGNGDWGGCGGEVRQCRDASERNRRIYRVVGQKRGCLGVWDGGNGEAIRSRAWWGADDEDRVLEGLLLLLLVRDGN